MPRLPPLRLIPTYLVFVAGAATGATLSTGLPRVDFAGVFWLAAIALASLAARVAFGKDCTFADALGVDPVAAAFAAIRHGVDAAIRQRLGLAPPSAHEIVLIRAMDQRMCAAELRQFAGNAAQARFPEAVRDRPVILKGALKPLSPAEAATRWCARVEILDKEI